MSGSDKSVSIATSRTKKNDDDTADTLPPLIDACELQPTVTTLVMPKGIATAWPVSAPSKSTAILDTVYQQGRTQLDATPTQTRTVLDANGLDVDGTGIKVGVISDSYNLLNQASQNIQDGLLPAASKIKIIQEAPSGGGEDEGRAMMNVVHAIAPGASLDFCTYLGAPKDFQNGIAGSDTAFADAILALAADGCKVIVDDISVPFTPWFQGGVIDRAIAQVEAQGVTYVSCAENNRTASGPTATSISDPAYQSAWRRTTATLTFNGLNYNFNDALDFGNGNPFQDITIKAGASTRLTMEWNQPWGHATADVAVVLSLNGFVFTDGATGQYTTYENTANVTPAGESVDLTKCPLVTASSTFLDNSRGTSDITIQVSIINLSGTNDPGLVKYILASNGGAEVSINGENAGSSKGHHEDPNQITVGAADAGNTPAFGNDPALNEPFSSSGLLEEWDYDLNGNKLATPLQLSTVDITGIDDLKTGVTGSLADFYGTSCAAPSIAAVAALMLQKQSQLTQPDIQNLLQDSAHPMINPTVSGAGLADAGLAVSFAETLSEISRGSNTRLLGTHLDDSMFAVGSNNILVGGTGSDDYFIDNASDQVVENSGEGIDTVHSLATYSIAGTPYIENLILAGTAAIDGTGNGFGNVLTGNGAANVLKGGGGSDTFLFNTAFGSGNIDSIADFTPSTLTSPDTIALSQAIFTTLATGSLAAAFEDITSTPETAAARILYNHATGALFYDSDGNASTKAAIQFATLTNKAALKAADFKVTDMRAPLDDFNGDRKSDIFFRNDNNGAIGYDTINTNGTSTTYHPLGGSSTAYAEAGIGDFNDDGLADILFRASTGSIGYDTINSNGTSTTFHAIGTSSTAYAVAGVGDFNGDGKSDILFRNNANGALGYDTINSNGTGTTFHAIGTSGTAYKAVGVGDFNGDGKADILFRNNSSNGNGALGYDTINSNGTSTTYHALGASSTAYAVAGVGDFNGDSLADILFRNSKGALGYDTINSTSTTFHPIGASGTAYSVVGTGDYNGDGISDILFRNNSNGALGFDTINSNGTSTTFHAIGGSGTAYTVRN